MLVKIRFGLGDAVDDAVDVVLGDIVCLRFFCVVKYDEKKIAALRVSLFYFLWVGEIKNKMNVFFKRMSFVIKKIFKGVRIKKVSEFNRISKYFAKYMFLLFLYLLN